MLTRSYLRESLTQWSCGLKTTRCPVQIHLQELDTWLSVSCLKLARRAPSRAFTRMFKGVGFHSRFWNLGSSFKTRILVLPLEVTETTEELETSLTRGLELNFRGLVYVWRSDSLRIIFQSFILVFLDKQPCDVSERRYLMKVTI